MMLGLAAAAPTVTGTVMTGALTPGGRTVLVVQVMVLPLTEQLQPVPLAAPLAVMPAGRVSLTVITPLVLLEPTATLLLTSRL